MYRIGNTSARLTKAILCTLLVIILFVSCEETSHRGNSNNSESEKWNVNEPLYEITYDKSTETFSSDHENIVFLETTKTDFKIVNFTDIHIEKSDLSDSSDNIKLLKETIEYAIEKEQPDLLTFTGDFGDSGAKTESLKKVSEIFDSYNIPWAPVFGNHDNESKLTVEKAKLLENCKNCLFKSGPDNLTTIDYYEGINTKIPNLGNYVVNIVKKSNNAKGYELVNSLIFMNTGCMRNYSKTEIEQKYPEKEPFGTSYAYGSLKDKQINWYEWAVKSAQKAQEGVKSTLFVHIPVFAYVYANKAAFKNAPDIISETAEFFNYTKGITYEESNSEEVWEEEYKQSFGVLHDDNISCCQYDDYVFESIKELGSTNLIICGHDHKNNTVINYQDVTFAYGTKTGHGGYYEEGLCGATALTLENNAPTVKHIFFPNPE